jgi:antitoxin component YwqK of YwqJK toxin-antitoxin module
MLSKKSDLDKILNGETPENKRDSLGRRTGLWVTKGHIFISLTRYSNGIVDGSQYYFYTENGALFTTIPFRRGVPYGKSYFISSTGVLKAKIFDIYLR